MRSCFAVILKGNTLFGLINKEAILFCWLNNKTITDDSVVGVYDKDKNICNMEDITIKHYNNGFFKVFQRDKSSGELSYDEMLGLVSALTMPNIDPAFNG